MMLIVDDVETNRKILKAIFEDEYEIMEACNGEEALTMIEKFKEAIDIVLLDLMMPGISGFDVLAEKRKMEYGKQIPVVVITSSDDVEDQVKAFDLGANEYIVKPFEPEIIMSRIHRVMTSKNELYQIKVEAQRMKMKSETDEMTGLCNKVTTETTIDAILKKEDHSLNVMIMIDIDNFKNVNDTAGHQTGDRVIKAVSNTVLRLFRKTDIVGRIGGDELCVLMVDVPNMNIVYEKVNELIQVMRYKPNLEIPEYVTLSIGVASNERMSSSYEELFAKADHALYEAKQAGKAQYREYGVEPFKLENDHRPVAVLISKNRNVCSTLQALTPTSIHVIEILELEELERISQEHKEKAIIMYVDVTEIPDSPEELWTRIEALDWIDSCNVFAVCEEGNTVQYAQALKYNIADLFTAPIDHTAFKRRMRKALKKHQLVS